MQINLNKKDAIWSFIGTLMTMGINFLILPFVLYFLDENEIGLYYIFSSLSNIVVMLDFGFSPSIARSMAYAWCGAKRLSKNDLILEKKLKPNYELMKCLIHTCKRIYCVIAIVALIGCSTLGTYYIYILIENYSQPLYYVAWCIYALAIVLNLLVGYYSVFLRGVGDVAGINKVTVISRILQLGLSVFCLNLGFGIVGIATSYLLYGLCFRLMAKKRFYQYKDIGKKLMATSCNNSEYTNYNILKAIWPNTWRDGVVTVSNYLVNQSATIIASLYFSLYETGIYSLCVQVMSAISQISGTLYTAYQPTLQSAFVNDDKEKQRNCMSIIIFSYITLFIAGSILFILIGRPIIAILQPSYTLDIQLIIMAGIYQFILKYRNSYCSYISTTNRLMYAGPFFYSAIINIILSVVLVGGLDQGIYGLLLVQIASQVIYNAWKWPVLVHKELEYGFGETFKRGCKQIKKVIKREFLIK